MYVLTVPLSATADRNSPDDVQLEEGTEKAQLPS